MLCWIIRERGTWERIKPLGVDLPKEEALSFKFPCTFVIFSYRPHDHGRKPPYSLGSVWPCNQKTWPRASNHVTCDCHHECEEEKSQSGWGHGEPWCCPGLEGSDGTSKEISPCKQKSRERSSKELHKRTKTSCFQVDPWKQLGLCWHDFVSKSGNS